MGDIEDGVSHFLCPDRQTWLPRQRYNITLQEKRDQRLHVAKQWHDDLVDETYRTRSDIARATNVSRARVTQLLKEYERSIPGYLH